MKPKMYDYSKLKGRIVEKFGTQSKFAEALNTKGCNVSNLLSGRVHFTQIMIDRWITLLEIEISEIGVYFFMPKELTKSN